MGYKLNEKQYEFQTVQTVKHTLLEIMPTIEEAYAEMCAHHQRKIMDPVHITNYMNKRLGVSLSAEDNRHMLQILAKDK